MFQALMDRIDEEILRWIFLYQPVAAPRRDERPGGRRRRRARRLRSAPVATAAEPVPSARARAGHGREPDAARATSRFNDPTATPSAFAKRAQPREAEGGSDEVQTVRREGKKVGRNDPCPCGSGKKYKKCHGAAKPRDAEARCSTIGSPRR